MTDPLDLDRLEALAQEALEQPDGYLALLNPRETLQLLAIVRAQTEALEEATRWLIELWPHLTTEQRLKVEHMRLALVKRSKPSAAGSGSFDAR